MRTIAKILKKSSTAVVSEVPIDCPTCRSPRILRVARSNLDLTLGVDQRYQCRNCNRFTLVHFDREQDLDRVIEHAEVVKPAETMTLTETANNEPQAPVKSRDCDELKSSSSTATELEHPSEAGRVADVQQKLDEALNQLRAFKQASLENQRDKEALQTQVMRLESERDSQQLLLDEQQSKLDDYTSKIGLLTNSAEQEASDAQSLQAKLQQQLNEVQQQLAEREHQLKDAAQTSQQLRTSNDQAQQQNQILQQSLEQTSEKVEQTLAEKNKQLSTLKSHIAKLRNSLELSQQSVAEKGQYSNQLQTQNQQLAAELQAVEERAMNADRTLVEVNEQLSDSESRYATLHDEKVAVEAVVQTLQDKNAAAEALAKDLAEQKTQLESGLSALRYKKDEDESLLTTLHNEKAALERKVSELQGLSEEANEKLSVLTAEQDQIIQFREALQSEHDQVVDTLREVLFERDQLLASNKQLQSDLNQQEPVESVSQFADLPANDITPGSADTSRDPNYIRQKYVQGLKYAKGHGVGRNDQSALQCFEEAARLGHAAAQFNAAIFFIKGVGTDKNLTAGQEWLRMAAGQGHKKAMELLPKVETMMNKVQSSSAFH